MTEKRKPQIYVIDTSAILSGKPFYNQSLRFITVPLIAAEFSPGGKDYTIFQLLKEKGMRIQSPEKNAVKKVQLVVETQGESNRLSEADCELLALAVELRDTNRFTPILLTDDYALQNMAEVLGISFQSLSQRGITKTFKWESRCRGCRRRVASHLKVCPVCGSPIVHVISKKSGKKHKRDV